MAELLLEILTEEIPARMQRRAAEDLQSLATRALGKAGLVFSDAASFVTPRRLALFVDGLPLAQPEVSEERRGPRVGAPASAIQGFLNAVGFASADQCEVRDTGKGQFYFATLRTSGRPTATILPTMLRSILLELPWPASMRFPAASFRWVRPIDSALCLFDGEVLELSLDQVPVGKQTRGHRFLAPGLFTVGSFADYRQKLHDAHVMLRREDRVRAIDLALFELAAELQLTVKSDPDLLEEVAGLVEWPVVLRGKIDREFLSLPPEVLTASMRTHQKYFTCLGQNGEIAPNFLLVSNMIADDGGHDIVAGNERVLRARLSDARFFWEQDTKVPLEARVPTLSGRVFHAKLGSVREKVARMERLARALARFVPEADEAAAARAAKLAKADLSTSMVGEFPELQGTMGRYYALHDGEPAKIANAVAEHYSPQGPSDRSPIAAVSVCVALADKIDTLVAFFRIGEVPSGSKDPFALRRAALGVIRIVLENNLRLPLATAIALASATTDATLQGIEAAPLSQGTAALLSFFADRLKAHLRDEGVRHDLIAAVFSLSGEDDLVRILARVHALDAFLRTEDGANMLVAYRRAANIVKLEEKKDRVAYPGEPDPELLSEPAEAFLAAELGSARIRSAEALRSEQFTGAMAVLAKLRPAVDEFFTRVTVNCDDRQLRANRLRLLAQIRDTLNRVADFSQIEG
jgi:glycyl-tRNA synthetase beta chain